MIRRHKFVIIISLTIVTIFTSVAVASVTTVSRLPDYTPPQGGGAGSGVAVSFDSTGVLYSIGGAQDATDDHSTSVYKLPTLDSTTWVDSLDDLPLGAAFKRNSTAYYMDYIVAQGYTHFATTSQTVFKYDIVTGIWVTEDAPLVYPDYEFVGAVDNVGRYYLIEGDNALRKQVSLIGDISAWEVLASPPTINTSFGVHIIYNESTNSMVLVGGNTANVSVYNITSDTWTIYPNVYPPYLANSSNWATVAYYDVVEGIVAGTMDYPNPGSLTLYRWNTQSHTFSLTDTAWNSADLCYNSEAITGCPMYVTIFNQDIAFGSGLGDTTFPSEPMNRYWTGNVVAITVEPTIDTWWQNFLTSLHMNSPTGKLIIGLSFMSVLAGFLLYLHAPTMVVISLLGIGSVVLFTAAVLTTDIYLTGLTIVGVGIFATLIFKFIGRGDSG